MQRQCRVLLVGSSSCTHLPMQELLMVSGLQVEKVHCGLDGLALIKNRDYDLVFGDDSLTLWNEKLMEQFAHFMGRKLSVVRLPAMGNGDDLFRVLTFFVESLCYWCRTESRLWPELS